jgi:hypothetical protein
MDVTIQAGVVSFVLGGTETLTAVFNNHGHIESTPLVWIVIKSVTDLLKNSIKVNAPNKIALTI